MKPTISYAFFLFILFCFICVAICLYRGGVKKDFEKVCQSKILQRRSASTYKPPAVVEKQYVTSKEVERDRIRCRMPIRCEDPERKCLHVPFSIRLNDGTQLEANVTADEGYCLKYESPSSSSVSSSCDARFGEPITIVTGTGHLRTECRCFWPSLVDRKNAGSNCYPTLACGGTAKLVHAETGVKLKDMPSDGPVDIHEFDCQTRDDGKNCFTPGKDVHTGLPTYVPTPVSDRTGGLCLYEDIADTSEPAATGKHTTSPVLAVKGEFVSAEFANSFRHVDVGAYVPNPCAFDAFRGVALKKNQCRLTLTPSGVGYCEPLDETVSTVMFDDDYLPNNGGRFSNACYKFTETGNNVDAYIAEYFVRPRRMTSSRLLDDGSDEVRPPPLPAMSVEIETDKIIPEVLDMLNARPTNGVSRKVLITQSTIPDDVEVIPTPFDKKTMSRYRYEHNDFVSYLPSKNALLSYWAPVQMVEIPDCDRINDERKIVGFTGDAIDASEYDIERQRHVVACREPYYDRRLSIVPNIDVNPLGTAYDANPTSAVLRFDKSDLSVRPYWYRSFFNNRREVKAYVSTLPSRPYPAPSYKP